MKRINKVIDSIGWFICQLVLTFSNKPSFFASKRLERSVLFNASVSIICFFIFYRRASIAATEVMGFVILMGTWAGFNVNALQKEKKIDAEIVKNSKESDSEIKINENEAK